jgi:hypothetical protein
MSKLAYLAGLFVLLSMVTALRHSKAIVGKLITSLTHVTF